MRHTTSRQTHILQRGAALITSLVILLVLTVLGISAMKSSNLQENIVGNLRDHDLAFQAAETGLRAAEGSLDAIVTIPVPDDSGTNGVYSRNYFYNNFGAMNSLAYNTGVWSSATVYATPLPEVSANPSYLTEFEQKIADDLDPESAAKGKGRYYYRITARGFGSSQHSAILLQEVYGIRRN
jgi:type IV pilus assembly protein PilX